MESTASSSPSPNHRSRPQFKPAQPLADRVARALCHHLRLLHHSNSTFYVLGCTGNVYTVILSLTPTCNCPDRTSPCKHILFVFLRVLGIGFDDPCLQRRTLRPCHLARLLGNPISNESLAEPRVREGFHQRSPQLLLRPPDYCVDLEDGATCPICLEVMIKEDKVVSCRSCRNPLHEECLLTWKRAKGRGSANCVMCRARWRAMADQDRYLNLAAYVTRDDMAEGQGMCGKW